MISLLNFPPITGLDLGRSRFMQNRKIFSRSSTGRRSKFDIFLFDLMFFRVLVLAFFTSGEKSVLATLAAGGRGLRGRPFGLFYSLLETWMPCGGFPLTNAFLAAIAALLLSFLILPGILIGVNVVGMVKGVVEEEWLTLVARACLGGMFKIRWFVSLANGSTKKNRQPSPSDNVPSANQQFFNIAKWPSDEPTEKTSYGMA